MSELNLSPSQLGTFNACTRRWYYSYRRGWKDTGSIAADFGSAWHKAMDVVFLHAGNQSLWEEWDDPREGCIFHARKAFDLAYTDRLPDIPEDEWRTPDLGAEMIRAYVEQCWDYLTTLQVVSVEDSLAAPVAPGLNASGIVDKIIKDPETGKYVVWDHKTVSAFSKDTGIRESWWDQYVLSPQASSYLLMARHAFGEANVGGFVVDAALVHKNVRHFERRTFHRTPHQLAVYAETLNAVKAGMDHADEVGVYPMNLGACKDFGGCPYQPICGQHHSVKDLPEHPPEYAHRVYVDAKTTEQRLGLDAG